MALDTSRDTSRQLADAALEAAGTCIDSERDHLLEASGHDWQTLTHASQLVRAEGRSSREHIAFQLLYSALNELLPEAFRMADGGSAKRP